VHLTKPVGLLPSFPQGEKERESRLFSSDDPPAVLPCSAHQILARFRRAERGMCRQGDVVELRQRMIRRQRFDVEDVEAGVADMA
jgi:hypothetical protein